jgi:hypothetical protein
MRIETFNPSATDAQHNWVYETMTESDGISHLSGLAEIDVARDEVVKLPPPPGWTGEVYGHRIIEGKVTQRLFMWEESSRFFGRREFLGGVHLPEENQLFRTNECSVDYDAATNILKLTCLVRMEK